MIRPRASSLKLRKLVFERDKGICANCGADCEKIKRVYWTILDFDAQCWYGQALRSNGQTFWEADHVIEVSGNGSDSLRNLQTLCVDCHRAKTTRLRVLRMVPVTQYEALVHPCLGDCSESVWWDHADEIIWSVKTRYDARFYVQENPRHLRVNIGPNLKPDYMRNAHPVVSGHLHVILDTLLDYCAQAPIDAIVM